MKILITGASRGIGLYLAQELIAAEGEVFCTYNMTSPPNVLSGKWTKIDIVDYGQVSNWVNSVVTPADEIVLINCAGVNYNALAHKASIENWQNVVSVNLIGTFHVIHAVLPFMRKKGFGRIINFSSIVAQKGVPGTSAYAASKAGLWGMTRSIAVENAPKGITINNLNLGYFDIGLIAEVPEKVLAGIRNDIPGRALGTPHNIYQAIRFLIASDYITGTSIDINGGLL